MKSYMKWGREGWPKRKEPPKPINLGRLYLRWAQDVHGVKLLNSHIRLMRVFATYSKEHQKYYRKSYTADLRAVETKK